MNLKAAVVFDLDGTLLPRTSVSTYLAQRMGHDSELAGLERRYDAGEISNAVIAELSAPWFAGMRPARVWELLRDAPWIAGIRETTDKLRASGLEVLLATVTWQFAADLVAAKFGLNAVSGTGMGIRNGVLTGRVEGHCDALTKRDRVRAWCIERGIPLSQLVAVGDSRSDLPLFAVAGWSIAVNPTSHARAVADRICDTDDLRSVLASLPWGPP